MASSWWRFVVHLKLQFDFVSMGMSAIVNLHEAERPHVISLWKDHSNTVWWSNKSQFNVAYGHHDAVSKWKQCFLSNKTGKLYQMIMLTSSSRRYKLLLDCVLLVTHWTGIGSLRPYHACLKLYVGQEIQLSKVRKKPWCVDMHGV